MSKWTETVPLDASRRQMNGDLRGARNATMLELLGNPRSSYDDTCRDPTNPDLIRLIVREDVGPLFVACSRPSRPCVPFSPT